jgi:multidrug efflux pump subunit AcrA (membrane-fusion protein)
MRTAPTLAALAVVALSALQAQDLPRDPEPGSFDVEPPLLPGNLTSEQPEKNQTPADVAQLERKVARAKESAAGAERLFRIGVLAKLEAENRAMRVVKLETELAQARVASAEVELEGKQQQQQQQHSTGEVSKTELDAAQLQLKKANEAAEIALANQKKAELDAAAINLARQQKLLALGSAGKSSVRRAEEKLAELKRAGQ